MRLPWHRLSAEERIGAPILLRELGLWRTLKVGRFVRRGLRAGEPFAHLGPPDGPDDAASREQIGRAILTYRALTPLVGRDAALRVTGAVVTAAGVAFLAEQLGPLGRAELEAIPEDTRSAWAKERGRRFFNASIRWDRIEPSGVDFTVTACRFPALCAQAGAPELAPLFCAVDEAFFGGVEPDVRLDRPQTIAGGAPTCLFRLSFAPDSDAAD